jgi:hypothetical protein
VGGEGDRAHVRVVEGPLSGFAGGHVTSTFDSVKPSVRWLDPFGGGGATLTGALLLGVFIY